MLQTLKAQIVESLKTYRAEYKAYYDKHAQPGFSRAARSEPERGADSRPGHVQLWQEQDRSADYWRVLHERHSCDGGRERAGPWLAKRFVQATRFRRLDRLPRLRSFRSARTTLRCRLPRLFRIEYWALEEAKIRRQPPEKELSRKVVLVVGGGSGIGREVARLAASAVRMSWSPIATPQRRSASPKS
jgi:hypothetical protein